ncbi:flagellar protein export ATPase FliI [Candidatus Epulonipiscium fishelsonii]|uniref:Flagellar protein export ATPase FliI n=1 Tax=Candidatus Epulonipiscium fishelsonii TaxID=77094 RepID=A0ACC8XDH5_9FIRM|nr:flagellar protein export ATPase FliI [Epulopiscium sp. SCG-B05WGA-EpuloA1]ONI40979.1 flagellar protein export ATPase FliI [Epulopiscium sp. SCG-B11WGA-EpuloA1]
MNIDKFNSVINNQMLVYTGKVTKIVGMAIECEGPISNIGDICEIHSQSGAKKLLAEVVGFRDKNILMMPLGNIEGIGPGCKVISNGQKLSVKVDSSLLGNVVDWQAKPISGKEINCQFEVPIENEAPNPLLRTRISKQLVLGIKAIDGMLSVGRGQRMGIFAGSGVGKSTLMGMVARNALSDINVIALIGERGREVREFIEKDLQEAGLKRSIVVVATSDQPALMRLKAAKTATALAEFFRSQGKDVLLLMDSLTRFSMAQREVGLSIGEPPISRGYTPSVFGIMPKLLERAGNDDKGSITGLYTVLVDGDDFNEPITDTARGILDGHIMLSRKLAHKAHYPAIDVLSSISRVMGDITTREHRQAMTQIKRYMAIYNEAEDLINVGAYNKGSNAEIDEAIEKHPSINNFLNQSTHDNVPLKETLEIMMEIVQ